MIRGGWIYTLALCLVVGGCGGSSGDDDDDDDDDNAGVVVRKGAVSFRMKLALPDVVPAEVEPERARLEGAGVTLAEDLSEAYFTSVPIGWPIRVGSDAITWVDGDGTFTVEYDASGTDTEWILYDPTVEPYASHEFARGPLSDLVAEDGTPTPLEVDVLFGGGCGMTPVDDADGDAGMHCSTTGTSGGGHGGHGGHGGPHQHHTDVDLDDTRASVLYDTNPTGTETGCLDDDGPVFTGQGKHSWKRFIAYVGSTCHEFVLNGCCVGEGGTVAEFLGLDPTNKACPEVHHGRQCQELGLGDLKITPVGDSMDVVLGEMTPITVHNNGCFGYTVVSKIERTIPLGGDLTSPNLDGHRLKHWDEGGTAAYFNMTYVTDRTMNYKVDDCIRQEKLDKFDQWQFRVDRTITSRVFKVKQTNLWRFTEGTSAGFIFSGDKWPVAEPEEGCQDRYHVHNVNPCTGSTVETWPEGECGHGPVEPVTL